LKERARGYHAGSTRTGFVATNSYAAGLLHREADDHLPGSEPAKTTARSRGSHHHVAAVCGVALAKGDAVG
jgi:hypothetical protein